MLSSPRISDNPTPMRAYSMPVTSPLRMAPAKSDAFTAGRGGSDLPDILALVEAVRHLGLAAHGHDVSEVELVLHLVRLLAAQQEVVAHGLVCLAVHPHLARPVLGLPVLQRLHDVSGFGAVGLLDGAQGEPGHAVGRARSVARRRVVLG